MLQCVGWRMAPFLWSVCDGWKGNVTGECRCCMQVAPISACPHIPLTLSSLHKPCRWRRADFAPISACPTPASHSVRHTTPSVAGGAAVAGGGFRGAPGGRSRPGGSGCPAALPHPSEAGPGCCPRANPVHLVTSAAAQARGLAAAHARGGPAAAAPAASAAASSGAPAGAGCASCGNRCGSGGCGD